MPANITITNNALLIAARLTEFVDVAVKGTGDEMVGVLKGKMLEGKSGRVYTGHVAFTTASGREVAFTATDKPYPHTASAPGEPPANWTGVAMGTIENVPQGIAATEVRAGNESAPYLAQWLEEGSPGGRIAPRPLVTPTAEEFKPIFIDNIVQAVEDAVNL